MRLDMQTRKKICGKIYRRYQKAGKKEKGEMLEEYVKVLECNRDYLAHLLANWGKTRYAETGNETVKFIAKEPVKGRQKASGGGKTGRPEKYHKAFVKALKEIWELFDFQCGKLLAPLIRGMIAYLAIEFAMGAELQALFETASPSTIDRKLKHEKKRFRIKGIGTTKPGALLKSLIPIRVYFAWDDRKPGFFELDTVAHCGSRNSGQFCWSLTITDVGSGWTEICALFNHAHRWVKEQVAKTRDNLPFPMLGIDSDNGDEFINKQLLEWCRQNQVTFTRGRPYRKNDNCFVEQKNYDAVRKTVGYGRFEGEKALEALADVYLSLNPLLNYWYPTMRLIGKDKLPSGRYKKIYEKEAKTPCQRLLESPDTSGECKEELRRRAALLNPVALKHAMDEAIERLLKFSVIETTIPGSKVS